MQDLIIKLSKGQSNQKIFKEIIKQIRTNFYLMDKNKMKINFIIEKNYYEEDMSNSLPQ